MLLSELAFLLGVITALGAVARPVTEETKRAAKLADVVYHCTEPNTVALTFDDGPYIYAYNVSDILTANNAKGTFFYNGRNYACIYNEDNIKRAQYVYSKGHQIAAHTWSHPDLTMLTWDQINNEMWLAEQAILRITGAYPAFFRPPYGKFNDMVLQAAYIRKQDVVIWDFDSQDSLHAPVEQQKQNYDNAIMRHPSNMLTINHEVHETTVFETLPYAIMRLQQAGYKLVTVAECLGKEPYQRIVAPQPDDPSTWHC